MCFHSETFLTWLDRTSMRHRFGAPGRPIGHSSLTEHLRTEFIKLFRLQLLQVLLLDLLRRFSSIAIVELLSH